MRTRPWSDKIKEGIRHAFELIAVVGDSEAPLGEGAEDDIKEEVMCFMVIEELWLKAKLGGTGEGATHNDGFNKLIEDDVDDPHLHDTIHVDLVR